MWGYRIVIHFVRCGAKVVIPKAAYEYIVRLAPNAKADANRHVVQNVLQIHENQSQGSCGEGSSYLAHSKTRS